MILLLAAIILQPDPGARQDLYARAVTERRAGHPAAAAALLEELVRSQPANADAWVLLGFARRDAGDREGARAAFETALRIAPNYQDARDGLASLARQSAVLSSFDVPAISIDASRTIVQRGENWHELRGAVSVPAWADTRLAFSVEHDRRFGVSDTYFEGRLDGRSRAEVDYYASIGGAFGADFRPVRQAKAGVAYKLTNAADTFVLTVDGAAAKYAEGAVWTLSPGFQKYFGGRGSWISGQWINIFTEGRHMSGGLVRIDAMATDSVRLFGGIARAPDLSEGRAIQTTSLFGGTSIGLNDRFSWRASVARDVPSAGPRRLTVSTGLDLRFK